MATQIHEGRAVLTDKITVQLGNFVNSTEIAIRNNLPNRNVLAETTLKGLLNRIHGWDLVNANSIRQNYPGIDLIDTSRRIGVQVTSTNTAEKVKHTLEQVENLPPDDQVDQLYILTITNDAPTEAMKKRILGTCFSGEKHIWNIPALLQQMMDLEVSKLEDIHAYLDAELGTLHPKMEQRHLVLRPVSAIGSGFVGREAELAEIQRRIDKGEKPIVLSGLGGMGKTELAVRFGKDYTGGAVYFIRFEDSFIRTLAKMANGIRPALSQDALSRPDEELCGMVLKILETCGEKDILIIDNVDSEQVHMSDLMKDPAYQKLYALDLRLLLTTRFERGQCVGVSRMENEALFRIFEMYKAPVDQAQMKALIDAVGGHTLTIDLIARTLADNWERVTAGEILTALENSTLPEKKYAEVETYYNQSPEQLQIYQHLRAVFQVAKIPETEQNILRCATLLPQTGMNLDLFRDSLPDDWRSSLAPLGRRGWLTSKDGILTIHPVIRLACREELGPVDRICWFFLMHLRYRYARGYCPVAQYTQLAETFSLAAENLNDSELFCLNSAGMLWLVMGQYQKAAELYERFLPSAAVHMQDYTNLAVAYSNAGNCYSFLGDHDKALAYLLRAAAVYENNPPQNREVYSGLCNSIGNIYADKGQYDLALQFLRKSMEIRALLSTPDDPIHAAILNNIGSVYGQMGDFRHALEYMLPALTVLEKKLPPDHPDLALTYCNVGRIRNNLKQPREALECFLKSLAIREKILPPQNPVFAALYSDLAKTYRKLHKYQTALEYYEKALAIQEQNLPADDPGILETKQHIHRVRQLCGRWRNPFRSMRNLSGK